MTHATELLLDSPGLFCDFSPSHHILDNSSGHVAELKCFKHSRLNSYPQHRITLIEVDGPDFEATVSATHAQLQSRKLGKIASLISNSLPNAPVLDSMGKSSHNNAP